MTHSVILSDDAEDDLFAIADWLAERADRQTANDFVDRIHKACLALADFPDRGTPHPGFGAEIRSIAYRRRTTLYYHVTIMSSRRS